MRRETSPRAGLSGNRGAAAALAIGNRGAAAALAIGNRGAAAALAIGALGTSVLASGCYNPDLTPGRFLCGPNGECPDNQVCRAGRCVQDGEPVDAATPSDGATRADLATPRPPDMTSPPVDMATPPTPVPGCARPGYELSTDVSACPGAFEAGAGKAAALCGLGFHLCGDTDGDGRKLDNTKPCPTVGFYAMSTAAFFGRVNGRNTLSCRDGGGLKAALAGCGSEAGATIARPDDSSCNGSPFPNLIRAALTCESQGNMSPWSCRDVLDTTVHRPRDPSAGGVLCCRS